MQTDMRTRHSARPHFVAIALCAFAVGALHASDNPSKGLRFDSPGVLDLAERTQKLIGDAIPVSALALADVEKIFAAPTLSEEQPSLLFSDDVYGCTTPSKGRPSKDCSLEHERQWIDAAGGAVKREGKRLSIAPEKGAPVVFVDWNMPETKTADGDEETHWYLGRLGGSGYYRVEVQFGHDAPGSFLINPRSGKTAFVHNGSDVAVPAPDGLHLVTFNTDDPPLSIRVAALDATGPSIQIQCDAGEDVGHVQAQLKGWHDAHSLDLEIDVRAARSKLAHRIALRLTQNSAGWSMATPNPAQLAAIGFTCR